jgi:hypothetical protein
VGLGSVLTGGGDLLLSAHKRTFLAGLETSVRKSEGQPGRTALLTTTVAGELCPDGGEGRKLLRWLGKFREAGRDRQNQGAREGWRGGLSQQAWGCLRERWGLRRQAEFINQVPHVSNGRFPAT